MKIAVSSKDDVRELMSSWDHTKIDALQYIRSLLPNSYEAMDQAIKEIKEIPLPGDKDLFFTITMFVFPTKPAPLLRPEEKVRKVKGGYTGAINLYKEDFFEDDVERSTESIRSTVFSHLTEQVSLLLQREDVSRMS